MKCCVSKQAITDEPHESDNTPSEFDNPPSEFDNPPSEFNNPPSELNLEFWMTQLPSTLRLLPITNLAIPGTHNSMTYGITASSKLAPDAEPVIRRLRFLGKLLRYIVSRWARNQNCDVLEQLRNGIRYLDLRIAVNKDTKDFYFVHGLYSEKVIETFKTIRSFLDTHPQEIVILDCQHFYAMEDDDHKRFIGIITTVFDGKLLPNFHDMEQLNLDYMTAKLNCQVIMIYRACAAEFGEPYFWPSYCFPTPWPNTVSIEKLLKLLEEGIQNRPRNVAFVSQCILTPDSDFVMKNLFSTFEKKCVLPLNEKKYQWIESLQPGHGVNIVISDCVELDDYKFAMTVVNLNRKLFDRVIHLQ